MPGILKPTPSSSSAPTSLPFSPSPLRELATGPGSNPLPSGLEPYGPSSSRRMAASSASILVAATSQAIRTSNPK